MNAGSSPDGSGGSVADFTVVALLVVVVGVVDVVVEVVIIDAVVVVAVDVVGEVVVEVVAAVLVVVVVVIVVVAVDVVVVVAANHSLHGSSLIYANFMSCLHVPSYTSAQFLNTLRHMSCL